MTTFQGPDHTPTHTLPEDDILTLAVDAAVANYDVIGAEGPPEDDPTILRRVVDRIRVIVGGEVVYEGPEKRTLDRPIEFADRRSTTPDEIVPLPTDVMDAFRDNRPMFTRDDTE